MIKAILLNSRSFPVNAMIQEATFQFNGNLLQLLPPDKRNGPYRYTFKGAQSVKHLIESVGVPHTEIGNIVVQGKNVNSSYIVQNGDHVEIDPISSPTAITPMGTPVKPSGNTCFILDNHLGRLAYYLRMLGIDTLYNYEYQDEDLALLSSQLSRILLSRDRQLLMRSTVIYGYLVRSKLPREQLFEVVERYDLHNQISPFLRCMRCNGILEAVSKEMVLDRLEPLTKLYFNEFRICNECGQIYWKGSHYERMQKLIDIVISKDYSGNPSN